MIGLNPKGPVTISRHVSRIVEEILNLLGREGKLEIRLEAQADAPEGFEPQTERTVNGNYLALKIVDFGFETE